MIRAGFISAFVILLSAQLSAQDYWMQRDSIKGPGKSVASAFVALGQGYIVAGLDTGGFVRRMYSYDVNQDDWDDALSIGGADGGGLSRGSACSFSIGNKGYICLGQGDNTNFLKDCWEYDPVLDVWTQKADYPGTARRGAVSFVIDGIAYVGTGQDASGLRKDFYKYDPVQNVWGNVADFAGTPRKYAVGFAMGYQGYVGTGDDGVLRNDLWQYQVFQNTWVQKASFPGTPRSGATAWALFPNAYVATGEDNSWNYCNDVWQYNYFTNQWTQKASLPATGRKHAISFMIGNVAYLGAGFNGGLLDDFYSYTAPVGLDESEYHSELVLYPVPATDDLTVELPGEMSYIEVLVRDVTGRDVTATLNIQRMQGKASLNVSSLPPGVYMISVITDNGQNAERLFVKR